MYKLTGIRDVLNRMYNLEVWFKVDDDYTMFLFMPAVSPLLLRFVVRINITKLMEYCT